jgi:antitoxin component YwqK of YwqJK toxin-antitoxin module
MGVETTDEKYIVGTRLDSEFYLSGFLKYECTYKGGDKHGVEWWFDNNHNPTKINIYYLGEKILSHDLLLDNETSE